MSYFVNVQKESLCTRLRQKCVYHKPYRKQIKQAKGIPNWDMGKSESTFEGQKGSCQTPRLAVLMLLAPSSPALLFASFLGIVC